MNYWNNITPGMYIEKKLQKKITSRDPKILFSTNPEEQIMTILQKMYAGKCFMGMFIQQIVRIVERSAWCSDYERSGGNCLCFVEFVVGGIVYDADEVIPQAEVAEIMDNGTVILYATNTVAAIAAQPGLNFLKRGDKLPIRCIQAAYSPSKTEISILAQPFVPLADDAPQHTINITDQDHMQLQQFAAGLQHDMKALEAADEKKMALVEEIVYSFAKQQSLPKGWSRIPITDIEKGAWTVWRPAWISDATVLVKEANSLDKPLDNASILLKGYMYNALKHARLVRQLASLYTFDKNDKTERAVWQLYVSNKFSEAGP